MKLYLAGKISGSPHYRSFFEGYEGLATDQGHIPLNPAILPPGLTQEEYMRICFAMLDCADMAWFLPGWEASEGARVEMAYCKKVGKPYEVITE